MFKVIIVGANSGVQSVTLNMRFNPYDTTVKEVLGRIQRKYSVDNPGDFGLMKDGEWLDPNLKLAAYNLNENVRLFFVFLIFLASSFVSIPKGFLIFMHLMYTRVNIIKKEDKKNCTALNRLFFD
jgi:hypothetical protein